MIDGAKPQPPQSYKPADLLGWAGKQKALAVMRVPTEAEEQKRAHKRQRQQLREQRLRLAAQGRSLMLLQGRRESDHWWREHRWERLEPELAAWLKVYRELILKVDETVRQLTRELKTQAPKVLPKGMGRLTYEAVATEVAAWGRLQNRRQVGSYAGLCGGVSASGQSSADLASPKLATGGCARTWSSWPGGCSSTSPVSIW